MSRRGGKLSLDPVGKTAVAKAIRKKRITLALGFRKAAEQATVSAATLCRVEAGKMPNMEDAVKIATWLGESLDALFGRDSRS